MLLFIPLVIRHIPPVALQLFHLVNSASRALGGGGAEEIEPQIEQSISVRIHQCQTTPSRAVCL